MIVDRIVTLYSASGGALTYSVISPRREVLVRVVFGADPGAVASGGAIQVTLGSGFISYGADFVATTILAQWFFESHQSVAGNQGTITDNFVVPVGFAVEKNQVILVTSGIVTPWTAQLHYAPTWVEDLITSP